MKIPPGRDVNDGDVFKFNADFKDERLRVHINSIQAKVTVRLVSPIPFIALPCFYLPSNPPLLLFSPAGRIKTNQRKYRGGQETLPRRSHRADHESQEGDDARAAYDRYH